MEIIRRLLDLPKKGIEEAVHIVRMENQMEKKVKNYSLRYEAAARHCNGTGSVPETDFWMNRPTGLTPQASKKCGNLLDAAKQYGMTVMISSHILSEIDQMATVVGIINQGCLIFRKECQFWICWKVQIVLRTSDNNHAYQLLKRSTHSVQRMVCRSVR